MNIPQSALQQDAVLTDGPLTHALYAHQKQRNAYLRNQNPSLQQRKKNLDILERMLLENQQDIARASCVDYGNRSIHETLLAEIFATVDGIRYARKQLRKWMKPQRRHNSIWFAGAKNRVLPQPKGVIGIISPWNYPLFLFVSPVTSALAAGNRCIVKMARESKHLANLMEKLVADYFDEETLTIIPDISGDQFTQLPFDHLVFTGSASTARHVMKAAAKNLTPVTLELGGKSPCIIDPAYNHDVAAKRIMHFKTFNGGQTCVAPDYVFIHKDKLQSFIDSCKQATQQRYRTLISCDYTSIINDSAFERLQGYLTDAKSRGAKLHNLMGDGSPAQHAPDRKLAPHIITDAPEDSLLMQEEIFGPLLPVKTYSHIDEVLAYINQHANPLGLYLFSDSSGLQQHVTENTLSGAIAINDCAMQVAQHDMPFGGIGESGMGQYHAFEGFKEFSKMRPIFKQARFASIELLYPPYGKRFDWIYNLMTKLKL